MSLLLYNKYKLHVYFNRHYTTNSKQNLYKNCFDFWQILTKFNKVHLYYMNEHYTLCNLY